jgi:hypothetical protein
LGISSLTLVETTIAFRRILQGIFKPRGFAVASRASAVQFREHRPTYFGISKVVLREFADAVFEHYKAWPTRVDDDVCFADVTCFRGMAPNGEKFLLLRIGTGVMLHVYR